ncbi:ComEC/Rec2 family competence protein [Sunxiuqinia indica]|uniref:ComEC/Rec2 family competence protein n=1 Tax=Sunxiuqinia indica TaxID=2692584 RepID=UPI00135ACBE2|nr:ComEC/Rec2 family competence protein [Sunxiuqinia indica]
MSFFRNNPFTKILSFWITGLMLGFYVPQAKLLLVIICIILAVLVLAKLKTKTYPFGSYLSAFYASCFALLAFLSAGRPSIPNRNEKQHFVATVLEYPTEKTNSYQSVIQINQADSSYYEKQKIIVYLKKDMSVLQLKPGDQLVAQARIQRIQNSNDLFAFDYQAFMANRKVYYSTYLPTKDYQRITEKASGIPFAAERFRFQLINQLKKHIINDEQRQVISALTLGYRKELSPETRSYFASTGAMHVLAVSGLHVGMIYLFLTYALGFLKRIQLGRMTFVIIIVLLLWSYALITGFSPSVQRATVMFSFILVANSLRRPASIYNSIAASAFLLLLINPNLIFEVGFQLSYAAVTSIVFFFPKIELLWSPQNKVINWFWQLFCVSMAAQIGTFALSVYYFHQFPLFFWLSNFIVIPAAYVILASTVLFFIASPVNWLAAALAKVLSSATFVTLLLLREIDQIPNSLIENIGISALQLSALLACLIAGMFFIKLKRKEFLFVAVSFFLFFQIAAFSQKVALFNQTKCIIYNSAQCLHLINGRKNYLIYAENEEEEYRSIPHAIRELQLDSPTRIQLDTCQNFSTPDLIIDKRTVLFVNQTFQYKKRKVNRQQTGLENPEKNDQQSLFSDLAFKTTIDSALEKGKILDFNNLSVPETFIADF